ncbi:polyphosphate kinase 1 [Mucilaginibacter sp. L3T2-6]|uniref:polyphosphate kinase 1 n=1 Tax=Mucilaginibacter sp. L3T2-6 TaxID=3062491 RepID=UPI0026766DFB|nr:polyphosphate kinase 1 [Mucilaginibacter sp. L3T2-6]MDO3640857.1 polyphosphate kinase 1 [Mucilaginibacter sp. L3T2-6]MDV6213667.1 polyphosphate kinase 1 [Mucilaginibacter sp. L3T2-6]
MEERRFFNRDLSWLTFNERVMEEAANSAVPLLERIKFLSIFSSNLDEFYRVRMPVLRALQKIGEKDSNEINAYERRGILDTAKSMIIAQQERFGQILREQLIPALDTENVVLLYHRPFPDGITKAAEGYFLSEILAFMQPVMLDGEHFFFPENNKLYFVVDLIEADGSPQVALLNIPSDELPRFFTVKDNDRTYIAFLDDIIRINLDKIFPAVEIKGCYSIKITRDAELDLADEYSGDLSDEIEKQLKKRDFGLATRFLYDAEIPLRMLQVLTQELCLQNASATQGGKYHNLKDFFSLPVNDVRLQYNEWKPSVRDDFFDKGRDMIIHTPYQSYNSVLRFFNEAAINPNVEEIYITLYRVASDSRIVNALISAARNGKYVQVMVELKARFDEANNLKWAKKMKEAGIKIVYSVRQLKVHAKIAIVKTRQGDRMAYAGLLATGNFNESTAKFYTDHILFTTNRGLLREMELVFMFLGKREKPSEKRRLEFKHLLVAQFNLQSKFIELIDREIENATAGKPAGMIIKVNNLEERVLINKLYEASQAGVKTDLIVRSICCLIPGVKGMSENITIRRIVDRYLEHGRVFVFNNGGNPEVFLGSSDWMNRNIYHRIEVCFPVYDETIKKEIIDMINIQLADNVQAVILDENLRNLPVTHARPAVQAQLEIYKLLAAALPE